MKCSFLKISRVVGLAAILIFTALPGSASAQTATNQALQLTPEMATSYWRECYEDENKTDVASCQLVKDPVTINCTKDFGAVAGDICIYVYPDSSRIQSDPNAFVGAKFKNFDSTGKLVGSTNTGVIGGAGSGTLEDSKGYDTGAECSPTNIGCWLQRLPGMLFAAIAFVFLMLASGLLWLAGTVFNWVVIRTVFQFGTYFGTSEGMLIAWGVVRDIANIGLLFGFILMGVLLILNVDGGGHGHGHGGGISAKKAIPRLIIFAVLLNFSLFASQFVIDVSNAFSSSLVTLAGQECSGITSATGDEQVGQKVEDCANVGISGKILEVAGVSKIWAFGESGPEALQKLIDRPYSYTVSLMLLSIFVLVTAMVLLAGAIMLVARVVILVLLMITSPIGFAGMAIPKLQGIASTWWEKLISQAFFAPAYLLLIFISVKLADGLMQGEASLASAIIANEGNTVAGNVQVVMVFMVVIGLMIASLVVASKLGAAGSSFATKTAGALTLGSAGFVGRRTVGRMSGAGAKWVRQQSWAETGAGRRLARIGDYGNQASFSLRNATGKALGTAGVKLDVGTANKAAGHGYHGVEEAEVKKRDEDFKKIREAQTDQKSVAKEVEERVKEREKELERRVQPERVAIETQRQQVEAARKSGDQVALDSEQRKLVDAMARYENRKSELTDKDKDGEFKDIAELKNLAKNWRKQEKNEMITRQVKILENEGHVEWYNPINITLGPTVAHHTIEKIMKEANKSALEKALKNAYDDFKGDGDGGGKPAPAPSAPAAGAPSGGGGHDDHPH